MAKLMNAFGKNKINPLIGSAGVSAVPMAARVSNKVGLETDPHNFLLMHGSKAWMPAASNKIPSISHEPS
jgi:Na+-transporting methylmalonyl-CoA/oxaloacetate decarboxylase beta subunit